MHPRSDTVRSTRAQGPTGFATLAAFLLVCAAGLKLLPWPDAIASGWLFGALMVAGGAIAVRMFDRGILPDLSRPRSVICYAVGALVVQAVLHLVAAFGF